MNINEVRLRAEIERLKETHERNLDKPMERGRIGYAHGCVDSCDRILSFIDSLEEESSCPKESDYLDKLMKEVQKYYSDNFDYITSDQPTLSILTNIARHFYELGQKDAASKYDEIEYNRQRAEEEMLGKTLDEAAEKYVLEGHLLPEAFLVIPTFKAGAKWMAWQGVTLKVTDDTTWGEVNDFIHRNCDGVKEIQIRKKEESK